MRPYAPLSYYVQAGGREIFHTRNSLGWLETRLAQNTLHYITTASITLKYKST